MNREKISSGLLDPRSKLAVFIAACLSAFSGLTHPQEFVLLALCVGITLLCQKWKRAFYTGLIFAVMFFLRSVSSTAIVRDTAEYHHAGMSFLPVYFTDVCSLLYCDTDFQDWGIYQCIYSDASAKRGHHSSGGDAPFCPDYPGRMADGESGAPIKRDGADMEKCFSSSAADDGIYAGSLFAAVLGYRG